MSQEGNIMVKEEILQEKLYYKGNLILSYQINYPQFVSEDCSCFVDNLNKYYKSKAIVFEKVNMKRLYDMAVEEYETSVANGFPIRPYEAIVEYHIAYNQDCVISLYYDQYEYTGGAHGNTIRNSDTWNVQTGTRIKLRDLFIHYSNCKKYITGVISNQVEKQIKAEANQYFEDYDKLIVETFKESNFYITKEGVLIYFQQYDIAPYSSGIPTFIVPYSSINL